MAETAALLPAEQVTTYVMDVRDRCAWSETLEAYFEAAGGRLDVLFNNAGVPMDGPLIDEPFEAIDRTFAINLMGMLNGAKLGYAYLASTPGSCLINTASCMAIYGAPGLATYSATKFAVRALTEALDGEWRSQGIRVRAILPSFVETPLLDTISAASGRSIRETVVGAGLEVSDVGLVTDAIWNAMQSERVLTYVGPTSKRMAFLARWLPEVLRRRMRMNQ